MCVFFHCVKLNLATFLCTSEVLSVVGLMHLRADLCCVFSLAWVHVQQLCEVIMVVDAGGVKGSDLFSAVARQSVEGGGRKFLSS